MNEAERNKRLYKEGVIVRSEGDLRSWDGSLVVSEKSFGTVENVTDEGLVAIRFQGKEENLGIDPSYDRVTIVHDPSYSPLVDADGWEIKGGDYVGIYGSVEHVGIVSRVTDPDGDMDDEGRPFGIPPKIYVEFPDGEDEFHTYATYRYMYDDNPSYKCDDLEKR